jgi:hypothetical protein
MFKWLEHVLSVLIILIGLFLNVSCTAQDSVFVSLSGKVVDSHFGKPIVNAKIEVIGIGGLPRSVTTDSAGVYIMRYAVLGYPSNSSIAIRCTAEEMLTSIQDAKLNASDSVILRDFTLRWSGPCIDTFAPGYIHFSRGSACPTDSILQYLRDWVPTALEITSGSAKVRVEILAATSFDEPRTLSKQRAICIKNILIESGLPDSVIVTEDLAQAPFYYCQYCEGCLPKFLYGTGVLLSRDEIRNAPNTVELSAMRRMVHLSFVHSDATKRDRTAKPTF